MASSQTPQIESPRPPPILSLIRNHTTEDLSRTLPDTHVAAINLRKAEWAAFGASPDHFNTAFVNSKLHPVNRHIYSANAYAAAAAAADDTDHIKAAAAEYTAAAATYTVATAAYAVDVAAAASAASTSTTISNQMEE